MLQIASIILPIFITIFIGYLLSHFQVLNKEHVRLLGLLVIKVSLPCLLLVSISSQDIRSLLQVPYLVSYSMASIIVFISALLIYSKLLKTNLTHASVMGLGAAMSNTGFIGSGLLYLFLGEKAAVYFGMTFLIENFIVFLMFLICIELSQHKAPLNQIVKSGLVNILKNPLIIALLIGFILCALQLQLPEVLQKTLKSIGQTTAPLGLLVIGGSLYGISISSQRQLGLDVAIIAGLKLVIMPLLVYGLFQLFPQASPEMVFAGVLLSSVSMVGFFAVFGPQYNMPKVPPILLMTTLLCMFSLSTVIHFLAV